METNIKNEIQAKEIINNCLITAWNTFIELKQTHPSDIKGFNKGIHDLQKIMGMRELRRLMPEKYICK